MAHRGVSGFVPLLGSKTLEAEQALRLARGPAPHLSVPRVPPPMTASTGVGSESVSGSGGGGITQALSTSSKLHSLWSPWASRTHGGQGGGQGAAALPDEAVVS